MSKFVTAKDTLDSLGGVRILTKGNRYEVLKRPLMWDYMIEDYRLSISVMCEDDCERNFFEEVFEVCND